MNNVKQTEQVKCIVLEGYGGYDKIKVSIIYEYYSIGA
jgi:hypothetical protein